MIKDSKEQSIWCIYFVIPEYMDYQINLSCYLNLNLRLSNKNFIYDQAQSDNIVYSSHFCLQFPTIIVKKLLLMHLYMLSAAA